jgi:beta-phosphoglucomutase-like phosphatase (HAD superfamily)
MRSEPSQPFPEATDCLDPAESPIAADATGAAPVPDLATLIEQLRQDRLWLLRQIDSGQWAEWRLDLAALERELGQLLEQASERLLGS